jgi:hypothetical protein
MSKRTLMTAAICAAALMPFTAALGQASDGAYRGMFLCEKMKASPDILHVPLDLVVHGTDAQFARPIFNFNGQRVLGSELGAGKIEQDGKVHLTSSWYFRGVAYSGDYSGTIGANGGTLSGKQSWSGRGDSATGSRNCHVALVPAPQAARAAAQPESPASKPGDK